MPPTEKKPVETKAPEPVAPIAVVETQLGETPMVKEPELVNEKLTLEQRFIEMVCGLSKGVLLDEFDMSSARESLVFWYKGLSAAERKQLAVYGRDKVKRYRLIIEALDQEWFTQSQFDL